GPRRARRHDRRPGRPHRCGARAADRPHRGALPPFEGPPADRPAPRLMQLHQEKPDYEYVLRGADGAAALVNERTLRRSFIVAPDALVEDWPVDDAAAMAPADLAPLPALPPEVGALGTGARQVFVPPATQAACLQRGVGLEVMTNPAAARTYSVLAGEGRRVVAGFIICGEGLSRRAPRPRAALTCGGASRRGGRPGPGASRARAGGATRGRTRAGRA